MTMKRKAGVLLAALSLAVFVASVYVMSRRAAAFNAAADHPEYLMVPQRVREFTLYDSMVSIQDAFTPEGQAAWRVTYGDSELVMPVRPPSVRDAPDLGLYEEWAVPLETWLITRDPATGEAIREPGSGRLVIVNRRTP